jgi:hypothetical protein
VSEVVTHVLAALWDAAGVLKVLGDIAETLVMSVVVSAGYHHMSGRNENCAQKLPVKNTRQSKKKIEDS